MQQPNYAIASLAASQRASRRSVQPFKANSGGPFKRAIPCPGPSEQSAAIAARRVQQAKANAAAIRLAYARFYSRDRF